uniref:Uncharacterized protein n=1 Tax=Rhodosorus marinus TaxID=101924 RepID=A0A7S2ZDZ1_9RHOD|mmetsp:Transcript_14817/g.60222  ORF Transcript_14817/g.60222 Transcript_14817/m.60222 type:complete len:350 (+) Transcript_14817:423-1472(+)|eukprot:CAMPEP_0113957270 /NCGR_PEP_ID=MMETSP0011_2-20120614/2671_1 /TAXON_ID=101924 /ORGANISM="Rhodosorus marinus" /LENGTH=349 /DNA_ID=CAMNT_0000967803 /DNA_START=317 /DNA_END=1366 /DNA_ORIENTATION=+ /assembly_acc=CAM_ASM_000156
MGDDPSLYQVESATRLAALEARRKSNVKVLEGLDQIPRRRTISALVPLGPRAIVPGRIKHTNEVMVLLGDNYFANVSAYDAIEIVKRRIARIDTQIIELTSNDIPTTSVEPSLESEKRSPQRQVVTAEKKSVSFSSDTKAETGAPRALPSALPSDPAQRSKLLGNFAEALASGQTALQNELNENVVLLEEEYDDQDSMNPVKVHGVNQDRAMEDYTWETESEDEETQMRSLEEEMALLDKLVEEEEESSAQHTRDSTLTTLRKGFLLESKAAKTNKKPPVPSSKASQPVHQAGASQSRLEIPSTEMISNALAPQHVAQETTAEAPESSQEEKTTRKSLFKQRMEEARRR